MKLLILIAITIVTATSAVASNQCMLYPVSMQQLEKNSTLVIEGKIVNSQSRYNEAHKHIYTSHKVEVYKVFKGNYTSDFITIVTEGGTVDNITHYHTNTLSLNTGQCGTFFLNETQWLSHEKTNEKCYEVYASQQGFFSYNTLTKEVTSVFEKFANAEKNFYPLLSALTRQNHHLRKRESFFKNNIDNSVNRVAVVPTITSFSPAIVSAGTKQVLTINGTGFGVTQGSGFVEFRGTFSPNTIQFVRPLNSEYLLWSDTQIQLFVPAQAVNASGVIAGAAGSGVIRVTNSDPATATSATNLIVEYSVFNNRPSINGSGQPLNLSEQVFMLNLVNANASGGYTFQKNTSFAANTAASDAFDRAFNNWKCNSGVNWTIGSTTSINVQAGDRINVITFDNNQPLPAGVAGRGDLSFSSCTSGVNTIKTVLDCDIRFSATVQWNFSTAQPTATQIDFETTALHELGHLLGIDHTLESAVMFPSLSFGVAKRVLDTEDINAAAFMMARSTVNAPCGNTAMVALSTPPPAPVVSISSSANPSCSGSSVTYTATTNNAPGAVFQWIVNGANAGTNSSTLTINPSANANVSCRVTVTNTGCFFVATSNTVTQAIINTPAPTSISGLTCQTNNVNTIYTAAAVAGATAYQWTVPSGVTFVGANNTQAVTLKFPSAYLSGNVFAKATTNGCTSVSSASLLVRSKPSQPGIITGQSGGLCSANPLTNIPYSISAIANTTGYLWTASGGITFSTPANSTSVNANYIANFTSGTVTVVALNSSCQSTSRTLAVTAAPSQPGAIAGPANPGFAPVGAIYSVAAVPTATSHFWSGGFNSIVTFGQNTTSANILFGSNGTRNVCVTAINSCGSSVASCKTVKVGLLFSPMSGNNGDAIADGYNDWEVFPNPFSESLEIKSRIADHNSLAEITLYDFTGKLILKTRLDDGQNQVQINTGFISKGIYYLQIQNNNEVISKKIVKD